MLPCQQETNVPADHGPPERHLANQDVEVPTADGERLPEIDTPAGVLEEHPNPAPNAGDEVDGSVRLQRALQERQGNLGQRAKAQAKPKAKGKATLKKPSASTAPKSKPGSKQPPMKRPSGHQPASKKKQVKQKKPLKMTPACVYSRAYHKMASILMYKEYFFKVYRPTS